MRKVIIILLLLLIYFTIFANLGVSYYQIMSGGFGNYFNMKYSPLDDGTPRYIGTYEIITLEIIGNKNNPISTTFLFRLIDDLTTMTSVAMIIQNWMRNTMVYSNQTAYNWLLNVWESNPGKTNHQVTKHFNEYIVTTIWKGGLMMINIERPGYKSNSSNDTSTYESESKTYNIKKINRLLQINITPKNSGCIKINDNEPKENINEQIKYGEKTMITAIAKKDYVFKGWYKNGHFITDENPFIQEITSSTNLEARFSNIGKISVLNNTCKVNEEVQIEIEVEKLPAITSMVLYILYDKESLKPKIPCFIELDNNLISYELYNVIVLEDGKIKVSLGTTKTNPSPINGTIITIEMLSNGLKGKTNIIITDDSKAFGKDYREIELNFEEATIFISE